MKALIFPGQGAQFSGMGKELYEQKSDCRQLMDKANHICGFDIKDIMFGGSDEELKRTDITQPALYIHSAAVALSEIENEIPKGVAGHSLGEFSALYAAGVLSFEDGLELVLTRAKAMQMACEQTEGTMAAIVGLEDGIVEKICSEINDVVVTANYNCPGQLVISGSLNGIEKAVEKLQEAGAKRAIVLEVGGAFHSPLMAPAGEMLREKIAAINFKKPRCPIYQNVNAKPEIEPERIKSNLIDQLTSPVRWTASMNQMIQDGFNEFSEMGGNGKVLKGLMRRINREVNVESFI